MIRGFTALVAVLATLSAGPVRAQASPVGPSPTFDAVRARGQLVCGTAATLPGFATVDSRGGWTGLYVDVCRTVAAAMFGDASRVRYISTTLQNRLPMLQSGEIDILASNTTWTLAREASLGLQFTGVTFYDGQGFLVRRSLGVTSARQLDGATICVQPGSTTELNLADYFRRNSMRLTPLVIETVEEVRNAVLAGRCDAYTIGTAALTAFRAGLGAQAADFVLLPEIISKEPLGPVVRKGDQRWFDLVRWAGYAPLLAEEFGITSANLEARMSDPDPEVQRFLGRTGGFGSMLGVRDDWAVQIVRQVGNAAEQWDRNVASLGLQRGANRLWTAGGLQYPPPAR